MELYRYISFKNPARIADVLQHNSLYFAYPNQFKENDAYDCKTYEIISRNMDDDFKAVCWQHRTRLLKGFSREKARLEIRKKINESGGKRAFVRHGLMAFEDVTKRSWDDTKTGILCLTSDPSNNRMWKKYCDTNNGICVCLDSMVLEAALRKVNLSSIPLLKGRYFE